MAHQLQGNEPNYVSILLCISIHSLPLTPTHTEKLLW